jgi:hypothetical protein
MLSFTSKGFFFIFIIIKSHITHHIYDVIVKQKITKRPDNHYLYMYMYIGFRV